MLFGALFLTMTRPAAAFRSPRMLLFDVSRSVSRGPGDQHGPRPALPGAGRFATLQGDRVAGGLAGINQADLAEHHARPGPDVALRAWLNRRFCVSVLCFQGKGGPSIIRSPLKIPAQPRHARPARATSGPPPGRAFCDAARGSESGRGCGDKPSRPLGAPRPSGAGRVPSPLARRWAQHQCSLFPKRRRAFWITICVGEHRPATARAASAGHVRPSRGPGVLQRCKGLGVREGVRG